MNELVGYKGFGPCIVCGATGYSLSYGGPDICPSCDCGIDPEVRKLKQCILALQTQLEQLKGHSTAVPSQQGARSTTSGTPLEDSWESHAFWARTEGAVNANPRPEFAHEIVQVETLLGPAVDWKVVPVEVARQLEREKADLRAQLERVERETIEMKAALHQASFCLRELLPDDGDAKLTVKMIARALPAQTEQKG